MNKDTDKLFKKELGSVADNILKGNFNKVDRLIIDIDGCICNNTYHNYHEAKPIMDRIEKLNKLYDMGIEIIYLTARGYGYDEDWYDFTKNQLDSWGVKYHKLYCNKPSGTYYIDDRGINIIDFDVLYSKIIEGEGEKYSD